MDGGLGGGSEAVEVCADCAVPASRTAGTNLMIKTAMIIARRRVFIAREGGRLLQVNELRTNTERLADQTEGVLRCALFPLP